MMLDEKILQEYTAGPVTPIRREDAPGLEDVFSRAEQALGFVPNSFFTMGRSPGILRAFTRLAREVIGVPGKAPLPLKRMAGYGEPLGRMHVLFVPHRGNCQRGGRRAAGESLSDMGI